jgi:hypothetical protein
MMETPVDHAPNFLERLAVLGNPAWTEHAPVRLMSVSFAPGKVTTRALTNYIHREEAEALQLSIVAMSRVLEREAGNILGAGSHVLTHDDHRTFGVSQFLVVESDHERRPIRAMDAWGFFRNNLGEQMTVEFLGSRHVPGGVFNDTSPQRVDLSLNPSQVWLDPALLPVQTVKQFGDTTLKANEVTRTFMLQNRVNFHHQALRREDDIGQLTITLTREHDIAQNRPEGPNIGL